ncbi:MAG: hypothetical protein RLZZ156_2823, partial [Deinococcota bacterium]
MTSFETILEPKEILAVLREGERLEF